MLRKCKHLWPGNGNCIFHNLSMKLLPTKSNAQPRHTVSPTRQQHPARCIPRRSRPRCRIWRREWWDFRLGRARSWQLNRALNRSWNKLRYDKYVQPFLCIRVSEIHEMFPIPRDSCFSASVAAMSDIFACFLTLVSATKLQSWWQN